MTGATFGVLNPPAMLTRMTLPVVQSVVRTSVHGPAGPAHARDQAARIRTGDADAFETMFREHYSSLCQFVDSYVHAPDVAEDVVQAVFLRIWESRGSWDPHGDARAYLYASCRNQALDILRHEQIVARSIAEVEAGAVGRWAITRPADAELEAAELADKLKAVVATLPERRRLVVVLRWQHQLSNPEIARVLGISVKGVEMQFSRALADLRRELGSRTLDFA
jgi:RNA polymerase sigma-70 factor (ECF subfamily)